MSVPHADRITVREACAQDAQRLSLISDATFLETFAHEIPGDAMIAHCREKHAPEYLAGLLNDGARGWLAEIDGTPVGYALLMPRPELDAALPGDVELKKIYVLSRFQGTGTAQRLFAEVLSAAKGNKRLLLGVKDDNHRAIAFYRRQGFEIIGTRQFNVGGALYDDFVFARDLTDVSLPENTP
ncbi:GNAT family N-acetyltransferase [Erythrobacter sp. SCSIO 43205]|uniref:GNAT family N-acetyltransferase n=1 Tax=Erythrobacter sp. SCSIO 43205 TaxID=2779361 RepID=UPI001CA86071|nr:GNAT family N-acetyltransferase [Erythrobacter sp. SCSIO 43205]UAB78076.1 GNAT family N-acetyltransferase [Erythrobacter sp. SCSIO 43205]